MVLEYLPTFARTKSPSHVGKYTSTMEHMGIHIYKSTLWLFNPFKIFGLYDIRYIS